jgi:sugar/nucleoside kinase (ribokinase family)
MTEILFAGLCTLDILQLVETYPGDDEKVTALAQTVAAGGPATNAAATVACLGGSAVLVTAVGGHPLAAGIHADLAGLGVRLVDLAAGSGGAPSVSSVVVSTGKRAVVSTNGASRVLALPDLTPLFGNIRAVQVDGHYPELAVAVLTEARRRSIPTLLDAGSWKAVTPELLPLLDVVVCSADFQLPGVAGFRPPEVAAFLAGHGVRWIAISRGAEPILRWTGDGFAEQPVPQAEVMDTLGAGDVLHGALTLAVAHRWPLTDATFAEALDEAAAVATRSCTAFGTRAWMPARQRAVCVGVRGWVSSLGTGPGFRPCR